MDTAPRYDAEASGCRAVFLHTGWRSCGTWLWTGFRALPGTLCYYEPLHEELAGLTPAMIDALHPKAWPSGHPDLPRPYFDEFRPLLDGAQPGLPGFRADFAGARFFAGPDARMPELSDYLALLLRHAAAQGLRPVLKFCRTQGRIGWMQRHFPHAVHVAVLRNPIEQFASARRQLLRHGNAYFLAMPLYLLATHRHQPLVAAALRHLDVSLPALPPGTDAFEGLTICEAAIRRAEAAKLYRAFLAFWSLTAADVPEAIDLFLDIDLISLSPEYRRHSEADLRRLTGLPIELSAPNSSAHGALLDRVGLSRTELWRCHRAAEHILAEIGGANWPDRPILARVGAMLGYASTLAMDGAITLHARSFSRMANWDALCAKAASLANAEHRAEQAEQHLRQAEQQLAAVHASRSWAVTAPLRWVGNRIFNAASADASPRHRIPTRSEALPGPNTSASRI